MFEDVIGKGYQAPVQEYDDPSAKPAHTHPQGAGVVPAPYTMSLDDMRLFIGRELDADDPLKDAYIKDMVYIATKIKDASMGCTWESVAPFMMQSLLDYLFGCRIPIVGKP